jgi:hypothetical protein
MKKTLFISFLFLLSFALINTVSAENNCIKEGEIGDFLNNDVCCDGLGIKGFSSPSADGRNICSVYGTQFTCSKECGNGNCDTDENRCNCFVDCAGLTTVIQKGTSVTINPSIIEDEPIKIENGLPAVTSTTSLDDGIVTKVNISDKEQDIEVSLDKTSKEANININGISVSTTQAVEINESKLYMQTVTGPKEIKISPVEASAKLPKATKLQEIKLEEKSQVPVYFITGVKETKILFFMPVSLSIQMQVDAQTGKVIFIKKPWWSFLVW